MRLNKYISDTGFCSRREADGLIAEGRVTVNGLRARVGAEVGEGDEVKVEWLDFIGFDLGNLLFAECSKPAVKIQRSPEGATPYILKIA